LDIGPGAFIWIAAKGTPGAGVNVLVGATVAAMIVGCSVGVINGVTVKECVELIASAVRYIAVGRYSTGKEVDDKFVPGIVQPTKKPARTHVTRMDLNTDLA